MQSNSDFIPNFSKSISTLRELLHSDKHYKWIETHQKVFNNILDKFKKETLLSYFDISKPTFIFTDAHQGSDKENAKSVAFASRCTSKAEKNYAQIDLEAKAVDFGLMRFHLYLVGAPNDTITLTDHHPLLSVFNGKRNGSIRTECINLRHQVIRFSLQYKKGITNPADYLSRHGIPWERLSKNEKKWIWWLDQPSLYIACYTPIPDAVGIKEIAEKTNNDSTLQDLRDIIRSRKLYIPNDKPHVTPHKQIISEITVLNNGTLLKKDKIILPNSLHEKVISLDPTKIKMLWNGV